MRLLLFVIATVLLLFVMTLGGCYNQRKATVQHGKAVATFPAIGADYCSRIYPCKDSVLKGDSVIMYDTLWGNTIDTITEVKVFEDTVTIIKTVQLPGKVVTKTITITDTMRVTNTAALDLCSIERLSAITQLEKRTAEYDDMKSKRNKWRKSSFITWGILALGLIGFIYRKTKKPV